MPALPVVAAVVLFLNLWLPFEAADAYQLERVAQIERTGTLSYDGAADPKVNIATGFYELMVGGPAPASARRHHRAPARRHRPGDVGAHAGGDRTVVRARSVWARTLLLLVPVVFHQFVLFKNDLFLALPSLVALAWLVSGSTEKPVAPRGVGRLAGRHGRGQQDGQRAAGGEPGGGRPAAPCARAAGSVRAGRRRPGRRDLRRPWPHAVPERDFLRGYVCQRPIAESAA
jgi:hypothetical protein